MVVCRIHLIILDRNKLWITLLVTYLAGYLLSLMGSLETVHHSQWA